MVASYYRELQALLVRTLKDRYAAEDVVQESYARVLAQQKNGPPIDKLRAVLHRTAYNLVIDGSRRAKLRDHADIDALDDYEQPAASTSLQPEERLSQSQRAQAMLRTIEELPPRCREAFVLHKIDGLRQQDIATQMGISVNMVERHVMRGMDACRACLDRLDGIRAKDGTDVER